MAKKILVNITLEGNEIQNFLLHKLATAPTAYGSGQMYYDTALNTPRWYDGATWRNINYINDAGTSTTDLWSADKIQTTIDNAISGGVSYQGGYDAAGNVPNLDNSPTAGSILKGYMYTVTSAGNFFTEAVSVGDVLIAEIDDPATLADWTVVERNLNSATETSEGTTEIATQVEVDAGTDDFRYITPLKLSAWYAALPSSGKFSVDLNSTELTVTRVFSGGQTTFTVTHSLNTLDTISHIKLISSGEEVETSVVAATANTTEFSFTGNTADGLYRVVISG